MKWNTIQLGEVMDVKHGYAFKSKFFADSGEYILLTPGNCNEGGGLKLKSDKEKYYTGEFPPEFTLHAGDVLVVMTDLINTAPILGGSFLIPEDNKFLHNQRLGLVQITDDRRIEKNFLYYLLNTNEYRAQVRGSASGATVRHTAPGRIKSCKVRVPCDLTYQRKIGDVLSAYDGMIENNRRRIQLLEESARLLYQEWFVRLRFPGYEHTRIVEGVPEGWEKATLKTLGTITTGKTPSTARREYFGGNIPFIKTPDMHGNVYVITTEDALSDEGAGTQQNKFLEKNAIIVSCIGAKAGVVSLTSNKSQTNQQINALSVHEETQTFYLYFFLKDFKEQLLAIGSSGSTMPNVSKGKFENIAVVVPSERLLSIYHEVVSCSFEQILNLQLTDQKLKAARDLLLPRLMSGEIVV